LKDPTHPVIRALDIAIDGVSVALCQNGEAIVELSGDPQNSLAAGLLPNIDKLLRSNDFELGDIGSVAVSLGPGSYTGIRIGIATALGLGRSMGLSVMGVSLLKAIAADGSIDGHVIAAVPTGREDIAWQIFDSNSPGTAPSI